jgi:hypothetical protein
MGWLLVARQIQHTDEALERENGTKLDVGASPKAIPSTCSSWVHPSFAGPKEELCRDTICGEDLHHRRRKKH